MMHGRFKALQGLKLAECDVSNPQMVESLQRPGGCSQTKFKPTELYFSSSGVFFSSKVKNVCQEFAIDPLPSPSLN